MDEDTLLEKTNVKKTNLMHSVINLVTDLPQNTGGKQTIGR